MNFSGWVAIPRSALNNTHTGKLSNNEQLVLLTLMLLADAKTGSGYINAAALRTYLPELTYQAAKRVLQSLQEKRRIYRKITHASKKLYPFWLHGYQVSDGLHRLSWINLSQVFMTDDIRCLEYSDSVPDGVPEPVPEGIPEGVPEPRPNNNKDHNKDTDKDLSLDSEDGESNSDGNGEQARDSRSEHPGDREVRAECADGEHINPLPFGLIVRDGAYYTDSGVKVRREALAILLGKETTE